MFKEVSKDTMDWVKPEAHDPLESMEIPTEPPTADTRTETCCKNMSKHSNNYLTIRSYPNYVPTRF